MLMRQWREEEKDGGLGTVRQQVESTMSPHFFLDRLD